MPPRCCFQTRHPYASMPLVSRAFTPSESRLEPRIREITDQLLDRADSKGELEVVADLATPLPVMVIAEMLGIPQARTSVFKHWSDKIVESDNTLPGTPLPSDVRQAFVDLRGYFAEENPASPQASRPRPGERTGRCARRVRGSDAEELQAFVTLLLLAGNETTTNLIANGMLALVRNPVEFERLPPNSAMLPRADREMLRYDGLFSLRCVTIKGRSTWRER